MTVILRYLMLKIEQQHCHRVIEMPVLTRRKLVSELVSFVMMILDGQEPCAVLSVSISCLIECIHSVRVGTRYLWQIKRKLPAHCVSGMIPVTGSTVGALHLLCSLFFLTLLLVLCHLFFTCRQ